MCYLVGFLAAAGMVGFFACAVFGMILGIGKIFSGAPFIGFVLLFLGVLPLMIAGALYGVLGTRLSAVWVLSMVLMAVAYQVGPAFSCSAGM